MKMRFMGLASCTVAVLMLGARQAHALWAETHLTPGVTATQGRTIRFQVKDVRGKKECRIVVTPGTQEKLPLRPWSNGKLYLNPEGVSDAEFPVKRGEAVAMKETRVKNTVTYTFQVLPEQLSRLRFEFYDSRMPSRELIGGGYLYWFNLREWAASQKSAV